MALAGGVGGEEQGFFSILAGENYFDVYAYVAHVIFSDPNHLP